MPSICHLNLNLFLGDFFWNIIFGIGMLGMALSSITFMMVVSGIIVCEVMNRPYTGWTFRVCAMLPGIGVLAPFFWDQAYFWLAIPTSVITLLHLPIAYVTYLLMINNKVFMGSFMPVGRNRIIWSTLLIMSVKLITSASLYMLWTRNGIWGLGILVIFLGAIGIEEWMKKKKDSIE